MILPALALELLPRERFALTPRVVPLARTFRLGAIGVCIGGAGDADNDDSSSGNA